MRVQFHCDAGCGKVSEPIEGEVRDRFNYPPGWLYRRGLDRNGSTVRIVVCGEACSKAYDAKSVGWEFSWVEIDGQGAAVLK